MKGKFAAAAFPFYYSHYSDYSKFFLASVEIFS